MSRSAPRVDAVAGTSDDGDAAGLPVWAREVSEPRRSRRNPPTVTAAEIVLGALGTSALAGGVEMWLFPHGSETIPGRWLDEIPVLRTWRVPGLVLAGVFGVGSLTTMRSLATRPRWRAAGRVERLTQKEWPWAATGVIGVALVAWIGAETVLIPKRSATEALFAGAGGLLVGLTLTPSFRRALATRGAS